MPRKGMANRANEAYNRIMSAITNNGKDKNPTHTLSLECIRNIIGCDATQYLLETGMIEIAGRYSETRAICCRIW